MVFRRYRIWWSNPTNPGQKDRSAFIITDLDEETLRECLNYNVDIKESSIFQGKVH
jgi:hypothetical protein